VRNRFGKGGSQIFRLRFHRQWQDEADEGNAELGNTWAFTAEGTENILASSAKQSPDPVPSFSQLPQDGTSFGNLGKVGFRDLTTYTMST
jgi:hypothetical protein